MSCHGSGPGRIHDIRQVTKLTNMSIIFYLIPCMSVADLAIPGLFRLHCLPSSLSKQRGVILSYLRFARPNLFDQQSSKLSSLNITPLSPYQLFLSELEYCSHPHDLAAIILYALRHLKPDPSRGHFYTRFASFEREAGYPVDAWARVPEDTDKKLLDTVSCILMTSSAYDRETGMSAAKLAGLMGYWIFRQDQKEVRVEGLVSEVDQYARQMQHVLMAYTRYV